MASRMIASIICILMVALCLCVIELAGSNPSLCSDPSLPLIALLAIAYWIALALMFAEHE